MTCACGAALTGRQRRHCSQACRDRAYHERKDVVTIALTVDQYAANALDLLCGVQGMTRSKFLRELLLGYLEATAFALRAPHEPAAAERATVPERTTR